MTVSVVEIRPVFVIVSECRVPVPVLVGFLARPLKAVAMVCVIVAVPVGVLLNLMAVLVIMLLPAQ